MKNFSPKDTLPSPALRVAQGLSFGLLLASAPLYAFNPNACLNSFQGEALKVCKLAINGDPKARYQLARVYGDAVNSRQVDYQQSFHWHRELARQAMRDNLLEPIYTLTMYNTGVMYADGVGVAQNAKNALFWFEKAAERGEALAMTRLGMLYETGGTGVTANFAEAQSWMEKAVQKENAQAKVILSKWILEGKVPAERTKAIQLLESASAQKSPQGAFALGNMYVTGFENLVRQDLIQAKNLYSVACGQYVLEACKRYHDLDTTGKLAGAPN
ncbi:MAG: sel1 repeat family protein [Thiotrichales bacterium]|nr:sel1 repeat family protein [Thiotrichales bacterium]